ncbi:MAG: ABC transporter ATP-binding protein [Legionellales bacterium]|nr:ABC transporter ATP-binding protein [Legionellales bacterium]
MAVETVVTIDNLTFGWGERTIFDRVSLSIPRGQIIGVMGPSGSGKTTLLRLIGGLLTPTHGSVSVFGETLHHLSQRKLYALRERMGLLFQHGALFTNLSVFDNVAFPLREHTQLSENLIHDIVLMKLQSVGLRGARELMPAQLSGGMARRVALARAIVLDPELIMYDEPFTGQDPIGKGVLVKLIKTINRTLGMTTILVSHDVQETLSIADHIFIISNGRLIASGTPEEITKSREASVQQFIQGDADGVVPFHYPCQDLRNDILGVGRD